MWKFSEVSELLRGSGGGGRGRQGEGGLGRGWHMSVCC